VAKAGTVPELHPELGAETDAAAVAGEVAAAPCRQKAAGVVLTQ